MKKLLASLLILFMNIPVFAQVSSPPPPPKPLPIHAEKRPFIKKGDRKMKKGHRHHKKHKMHDKRHLEEKHRR